MRVMEDFDAVRQRFSRISGALNERLRRLFAATEAEVLGYGGFVGGSGYRSIATRYHGGIGGTERRSELCPGEDVGVDSSTVPAPVDLSKLAPARHATHSARASGQSHLGGRTTAQDGLQSSSQPEDQGGCHTPRPQCSVQVHQCAHQKGIGRRRAFTVNGTTPSLPSNNSSICNTYLFTNP